VVTSNGWKRPWRVPQEVEFFSPDSGNHPCGKCLLISSSPWGNSGQNPNPTIKAMEGNRVSFFVTNKLPEHTSNYWYG
jgi:manganese oxidase